MIEKLKARMNDLADEAEKLYQRKMELDNEANNIDARIAQIVGAMQELDKLSQEIKAEDVEDVEDVEVNS